MKLLTITIPCYNSQDYMEKSICSALTGGDRVEIIIVDDGSSDNTLQIAKKYEEKFPNIVRVIHQENGGHGEAVNTGIKNATGLYFKVVDSDDCLGRKALEKVLNLLEEMVAKDAGLDMLVSNFMYDKQGARHKKIMRYRSAMTPGKMLGWEDIHFGRTQYLLMHSVIYRTKILRECGMELPKHTFYVDNIYVFQPLPYVKNIYYLDVCLYKYFIGRDDQSVNEKVMIGRIDQQIKVNKLMIDAYDLTKIKNKKLRDYMVKYLTMMMTVSSVFLIKEGSEESLLKREELWEYLKNKNKIMYRMINKMALSKPMQFRSKAGRKIVVWGYSLSQKIYGFN